MSEGDVCSYWFLLILSCNTCEKAEMCSIATVSEPLESSAEEQKLFWREKNDAGTKFKPAVEMQLMGARNLIVPGIKGTFMN